MGSYLERKKWVVSTTISESWEEHETVRLWLEGISKTKLSCKDYIIKKGKEKKSDFKFYHIQTIKSIVSYIIRTHLNWTSTIKRRPFIKKPSATFECILFSLSIYIYSLLDILDKYIMTTSNKKTRINLLDLFRYKSMPVDF